MAFTTIPSAGAKLRASVLSALITDLLPVVARKTSDQTVNNSTTLVNDNELFCAAAASTLYELCLQAEQNSNATANFKFAFTLPAGATFLSGYADLGSSAANEQLSVLANAGPYLGVTGAAADSLFLVRALVLISTTAGNITLQWAQNTANASNTIVRSGGFMTLRKLG